MGLDYMMDLIHEHPQISAGIGLVVGIGLDCFPELIREKKIGVRMKGLYRSFLGNVKKYNEHWKKDWEYKNRCHGFIEL